MSSRVFMSRILAIFRRGRLDRELDDEIAAHLELATAENIARGMPPDEARLAARRSFGGVAQTKEIYRDRRGWPVVDGLANDVRHAFRALRQSPGYTSVAIVSLVLGIGANTAIFTLLDAVVYRDIHVARPASLIQLTTSSARFHNAGMSFPTFEALSQRQQVCSALIGWTGNGVSNVEANGSATRGDIWAVTGNFYEALGIAPAAGRLLEPADVDLSRRTVTPVAVIGYGLWQRQFGGSSRAVGSVVKVEGVPFTVIGVAPKGFTGLGMVSEPDVTVPLIAMEVIAGYTPDRLDKREIPWLFATGRLRPGVSLGEARAQLRAVWPDALGATVPLGTTPAQRDRFLATRLDVEAGGHGLDWYLRPRFARPLYIVLGVAGLILLIACVNVAGLMLSRAAARRHEIGVRLAIGASRWRIARQMLAEGLLLASLGSLGGVAIAYNGSHWLSNLLLRDYLTPATLDLSPDLRVLGFAMAVALAAGMLLGLVPAWKATRPDPLILLKPQERIATRVGRAGHLTVVAQMALSLLLLMNVGLLVRTIEALRHTDPGYRTDRLLFVLSPRPDGYKNLNEDSYYPELLRRISSVPGVRAAALAHGQPGFMLGQPPERVSGSGESHAVSAIGVFVGPKYFETLGMARLAGRDFRWSDNSGARRVAILSRSLAGRLFPSGDAIGRDVAIGLDPGNRHVEVIGVAEDARPYDIRNPNLFAIYVPILQRARYARWPDLVVDAPTGAVPAVRRAVESLGRESVLSSSTVRYVIERSILQERIASILGAFFGGLALLLASIGLYSVTSYAVSGRIREIGIRMAIGARPHSVLVMIGVDTMRLVAIGIGIGIPLALTGTGLVSSLVYGVGVHDPMTLVASGGILVLVSAAAAYIPATRAARVDPMVALRAE